MELVNSTTTAMLTSTDERKRLLGLASLLRDSAGGTVTDPSLIALIIQRFVVPSTLDKKSHLMSRRLAYMLLRSHVVSGPQWIALANAIDRDVQMASTVGAANLTAAEVGVIALRTIAALPHSHVQEYVRSRWETLVACIFTSQNQSLRAAAVTCIVVYATPPAGLEAHEQRAIVRTAVLQRPRFAEVLRKLLLDANESVCLLAFQLLSTLQLVRSAGVGAALLIEPTSTGLIAELGLNAAAVHEVVERCTQLPVQSQVAVINPLLALVLGVGNGNTIENPSGSSDGSATRGDQAHTSSPSGGGGGLHLVIDLLITPMIGCDWNTGVLVSAATAILTIVSQRPGLLIALYPAASTCCEKLVVAASTLVRHSISSSARVPGLRRAGRDAVGLAADPKAVPPPDEQHLTTLLGGASHEALFTTLRGLLLMLPCEARTRSVTQLLRCAKNAAREQVAQWAQHAVARKKYESTTSASSSMRNGVSLLTSLTATVCSRSDAAQSAAEAPSVFDADQGDDFAFARGLFALVAEIVVATLLELGSDSATVSAVIGASHAAPSSVLAPVYVDNAAATVLEKVVAQCLDFELQRLLLCSRTDTSCSDIPSAITALLSKCSSFVQGSASACEAEADLEARGTFRGSTSSYGRSSLLNSRRIVTSLFVTWQIVIGVVAPSLTFVVDAAAAGQSWGPLARRHPFLVDVRAAGPHAVPVALISSHSSRSDIRAILSGAISILSAVVSIARSSPGAADGTMEARQATLLCSELDDAVVSAMTAAEVAFVPGILLQHAASASQSVPLLPCLVRALPVVETLVDVASSYALFSAAVKHITAAHAPSELLCKLTSACAATIITAGVVPSNSTVAEFLDECRAHPDGAYRIASAARHASILGSCKPFGSGSGVHHANACDSIARRAARVLAVVATMRPTHALLLRLQPPSSPSLNESLADGDANASASEFELRAQLFAVMELFDIAAEELHSGRTGVRDAARAEKLAEIVTILLAHDSRGDVEAAERIAEEDARRRSMRQPIADGGVPLSALDGFGATWAAESSGCRGAVPSAGVKFLRSVASSENDPVSIELHAAIVRSTSPSAYSGSASSVIVEVVVVMTNKTSCVVDEVDVQLTAAEPVATRSLCGLKHRQIGTSRGTSALLARESGRATDAETRLFSSDADDTHCLHVGALCALSDAVKSSLDELGLTVAFIGAPKRSLFVSSSPIDAAAPSTTAVVQHWGGGHFVVTALDPRERAVAVAQFAVTSGVDGKSCWLSAGASGLAGLCWDLDVAAASMSSSQSLGTLLSSSLGIAAIVTTCAFKVAPDGSDGIGRGGAALRRGGGGGGRNDDGTAGSLFDVARADPLSGQQGVDANDAGDSLDDDDEGDGDDGGASGGFDLIREHGGGGGGLGNGRQRGVAWLSHCQALLPLIRIPSVFVSPRLDGPAAALMHEKLREQRLYRATRVLGVLAAPNNANSSRVFALEAPPMSLSSHFSIGVMGKEKKQLLLIANVHFCGSSQTRDSSRSSFHWIAFAVDCCGPLRNSVETHRVEVYCTSIAVMLLITEKHQQSLMTMLREAVLPLTSAQ